MNVHIRARKTMRLLWLLFLLVLAPAASHAQSDWKLEMFSDAQMSSCAVNFNGPGLFQIHFVHTGSGESMAVGFALYPPACMTGAFWAGDRFDTQFDILSFTQADIGVAIAYRGCVALPVYLGYVQFYATAPSEACCEYRASEATFVGVQFIGVDCALEAVPVESGRVILNPTPNCPCESPVATQSTTWGGIKSLYR